MVALEVMRQHNAVVGRHCSVGYSILEVIRVLHIEHSLVQALLSGISCPAVNIANSKLKMTNMIGCYLKIKKLKEEDNRR